MGKRERREEGILKEVTESQRKRGLQDFPGSKFSTMFLFLSFFFSSYIITEMHCC